MSSTAEKLKTRVTEALETGQLSEKDHEWIMKEIHRDGTIDAEESALLSSLFKATQQGTLTIVADAPRKSSHELDTHKREALDRFAEREERRTLRRANTATTSSASSTREIPQEDIVQVADETTDTSVIEQQLSNKHAAQDGQGAENSSSTPNETKAPTFDQLFQFACTPRDTGPAFSLQNDRLLDVKLEGKVWMKTGAMVGYYGNVTFTREGISEHGLRRMMKKAVTGEGASLTKAIGSGNLYLADQGKKISVIDLRGQSLTVNGPSILAFQDCIDWDITFLKQVAAMITGGFFQVRLCGMGIVAITTHFDPIVLKVSPSNPVMTDYHATVAWSSGVSPSLKTDVSMQTMIGRSSGETLQLAFHGEGFVVIQPFEEIPASE